MDAEQLDALSRTLAAGYSRRGVTRLLGGFAFGGPMALLGLTAAEARRKKKKKHKKTSKKSDALVPSPRLAPVIVTCAGPSDNVGAGSARHAQSFTAPVTGQLISAQVELLISNAGNGYILDIRTLDNAGMPTGTILASGRINTAPAASPTAPVTVFAEFSPSAPVQAGTGYALAVTADPGQPLYVGTRSGRDACPGDHLSDTQGNGEFFLNSGDLVFSVTIQP